MNNAQHHITNIMRRGARLVALLLLAAQTANASTEQTTDNTYEYVMNVNRSGLAIVNGNVVVSINLTAIQDVPASQSVVLAPVLEDQLSSRRVDLPYIFINSRNQQIYFDRNLRQEYPDAIALRKKKGVDLNIDYIRTVKYEPWMDNAELKLRKQSCACNNPKDRGEIALGGFGEKKKVVDITLYPVYLLPPADNNIKVREERGSAYLCFEVDKWDIKPDYMSNPTELKKIHNSVNLVRNDSDVTITKMTIEGYASPEAPYEHNLMLSDKRTEALRQYLNMTNIGRGIKIEASGMGENWEGFMKQLNTNFNIPQRSKLLSIAQSNLLPDDKERQMRKEAPEGFAYVVKNLFPELRCTNYTVIYTVRPFTLEESERVFETRPINLNLNEIYRLADKYAANQQKYYDIIRKAYMLYPNDSYINLTLSCLAIKKGSAQEAAEHLSRVNDCPEKTMNLGLVAYLNGDFNKAVQLVNEAYQKGVKQASVQLAEFEKIKQK